jgi:hypothetical protein
LIVLSIWHEERCVASFRMPVRDAGRIIAAVADAMSRAVRAPAIELARPPQWLETARRLQSQLRNRVSALCGRPSDAGLRIVRTADKPSTKPSRDVSTLEPRR